ncbi:MAG: YihY/virulence factor BrkB family protein [Gemmatimonadaceae bacterium]
MTEQAQIAAPPPAERPPIRRSLAVRSSLTQWWETFRDYARRVWISSGEDNVFFLASGIAFNIMLTAVPFVILVISGLTYALGLSPDASLAEVTILIDRFLPPYSQALDATLHQLLEDIVGAREALGVYGALTFIWFSTRLFGSLRTVLTEVFHIENDRSIIAGKWFDVRITIYSSFFLVVYMVLSTYLAVASSRGVAYLIEEGLRRDVMGGLEYAIGRSVAFVFIVAIFWSLYRYLPHRKIRWQQALVGALSSGGLLELARNVWTMVNASFNPGSVYSGTLYTVISLVFWVYYAALIFVLGGEVAQAHETRRVRRMQRETFE